MGLCSLFDNPARTKTLPSRLKIFFFISGHMEYPSLHLGSRVFYGTFSSSPGGSPAHWPRVKDPQMLDGPHPRVWQDSGQRQGVGEGATGPGTL